MEKWWRKILVAVVAAGLLCLLGACDLNLDEELATQLATPSDLQDKLAAEADAAYNQQLAEEFNDDWRGQWEQASAINALGGLGEALEIPVEGSSFTVADYQQMVNNYLQRSGDAWLAASAAEPNDRLAISGFEVPLQPDIIYMTPTGELPAILECRIYYSLNGVSDNSPLYAGGGWLASSETSWLNKSARAVFRVDSTGTLAGLSSGTDSRFKINDAGLIPIGHINAARRLYGWFTDNAPQLGTETITVDSATYYQVIEDYLIEQTDGRPIYDDLRSALEYYLPEDIAAGLLATDTFIDVDGEIYMKERADSARPQVISEKWSIVEESWERCVYRAEVVQLLDGQQSTHTYDYVFANGQLIEFAYF